MQLLAIGATDFSIADSMGKVPSCAQKTALGLIMGEGSGWNLPLCLPGSESAISLSSCGVVLITILPLLRTILLIL